MSDGAPTELPEAEVAAADLVRRLGEALLGRDVAPAVSAEVAEALDELVALVERCPPRTKVEAFSRYPGHQRIEHFVASGRWPEPPPDGAELTFDALSFVGGRLNPFSAGVRYWRDGDEAVATARFSTCYEGPPSRAHGGITASVFDEVMGAVFRVRGLASAFTGTLTVRYVAPAPIDADVEFRARLSGTEGRKHRLEGTATGPGGVFAEAAGTFIEMDREQFAAAVAAGSSVLEEPG